MLLEFYETYIKGSTDFELKSQFFSSVQLQYVID